MHQDPIFKGRSLGFSSDLSIAAPLKRGLVPALDAVSYKTRAQRLLDTLHLGRMRNHEHAYARLFSDAVERVGVIQSVRVAVLEPEDKLLLTVSFDGNWDAYIRTLWVKVGGLLDVIFCNTEGYVEARLHPCEAWAEWVRTHQVQTHFFYGSADGSATDLLYLRRQERLRQDRAASDAEPPPGMLPRAEQRAREMLDMTDLTVDEDQWPRNELMIAAFLRQGLQSLAGLHRLADWYVPGTPDGAVLHRAAHELLQDFVQAWDRRLFKLAWANPATRLAERFSRQVDWLFGAQPAPRVPVAGDGLLQENDRRDVQGGIVGGYDGITHGALLMFSFADALAGGRFLEKLRPELSVAAQDGKVYPNELRRTLFLPLAGLRRLGLEDGIIATLPEAFVQGMASRAGLLGDRHDNHPERWSPPRRQGGAPDDRIELGAVHAVVYLRVNGPDATMELLDPADPRHPLQAEIQRLAGLVDGARLLAVEPLRRLYADAPPADAPPLAPVAEEEAAGLPASITHRHPRAVVREHFGFADGNGQPGVGPAAPDEAYPGNNLPLGEFLLGHPGSGDVQATPDVPVRPVRRPPAWLRNSSFLVVRKYRQWPERFDAMLKRTARVTGLKEDEVAARLMGRDRQGYPLVRQGSNTNAFTYLADPAGNVCPLHAHVRRANPRRLKHDMEPGDREPRILRRSLSYGPAWKPGRAGDAKVADAPEAPEAPPEPGDTERGLMFMAYNADIAEQFEVVQRWLAGGHATDTGSAVSCPIVGVPEPGRPRRFEFARDGRLARFTLDGEGSLLADAEPLVRLEWGAYWLAPSLSALSTLSRLALRAASSRNLPFDAARGQALLQGLARAGKTRWKQALEDVEAQQSFDAASLWAAVRAGGGARRCPMGLLVGSGQGVEQVLKSPASSVSGYAKRMARAMGPIFLGLDDRADGRYQAEAGPVVDEIRRLDARQAFDVAAEAVRQRLCALEQGAREQADMAKDPVFELVLDWRELVDEVLARLCEAWFGLDAPMQGAFFERGGFAWPPAPGALPRYPGHFMAPSRYIFQPRPGTMAEHQGQTHAQALTAAMTSFLAQQGATPLNDPLTRAEAPVGRAIQLHPLAQGDLAFAARTMVGAIMGFVPTMDGALRAVMAEWLRSGEFGRLRASLRGTAQGWDEVQRNTELGDAMDRALQLRCVPDLVWRTATAPIEVAPGVVAEPGERLVLGLGSAAQEALAEGRRDERRSMFGGVREAPDAPTHACPGYAAARAAMLGALVALLRVDKALQPLPAATAWRLAGATDEALPVRPAEPIKRPPKPASGARLLLCWGDSWLDYREPISHGPRSDLLEQLRRAHAQEWRAEGRGSFASYTRWGRIRDMAAGRQLFCAELRARIEIGERPVAIVLSGGGNDSTGTDLFPLVLPYKAGGPYLHAERAKAHVDSLIRHYAEVLDAIAETSLHAVAAPGDRPERVPVLIHGYDHPQPGHGLAVWLWPVFRERGFEGEVGEAAARQAMRELIDALNEAQIGLSGREPYRAFVRHVDLRGTIEQHWPGRALEGWSNELHPTKDGFAHVMQRMLAALDKLTGVSPTPRSPPTG